MDTLTAVLSPLGSTRPMMIFAVVGTVERIDHSCPGAKSGDGAPADSA
jgi:hypothetical protein